MTATITKPSIKTLGLPTPFLRLLEVDSHRTGRFPGSIQQIRDGELTAIVIRGVYDSDFMAAVTERLERHDPAFVKTLFPEKFRSWFFGRNLNLVGTDPLSYFAQAAEFHRQLQELFPGTQGLRETLFSQLSQLDASCPYMAAPGPEPRQSYMMTTLRGHAEGGYIPAHCDNEQSVRDSYEHLQTIVGPHMYSAVLMIGAPEDGGDLEVYDHRVEADHAGDRVGALAGKLDTSALSSVSIRLNPGDVVVVDSGRYLHRVTPVIGSKTRWVACSFMARSLERNAVYCWG